MTSQLLIELDSISTIQPPSSTESADFNRVFVLAATNALDAIDSAFLQPGTEIGSAFKTNALTLCREIWKRAVCRSSRKRSS